MASAPFEDLPDAHQHAVPVLRSEGHGFEDEQIQSSRLAAHGLPRESEG